MEYYDSYVVFSVATLPTKMYTPSYNPCQQLSHCVEQYATTCTSYIIIPKECVWRASAGSSQFHACIYTTVRAFTCIRITSDGMLVGGGTVTLVQGKCPAFLASRSEH